jgi:ABC-type nitrate/sulfonate/bicarbonate transport system substrate-binding protein
MPRYLLPLLLAATVVVSTAGCGDLLSTGSDDSGAGTVTVGISGNVFDLSIRLADDKGYFKQQGLTIKYVTVTASTGPSALAAGSLQFLNESPTGFLSAVAKKIPQTAIAANGLGNPLGLVVSNGFARAHQLTGQSSAADAAKALTGSRGGASSANTKAEAGIFLQANGVDPTKIKWFSLPSPAADKAALANGQIDWFVTSQPLPLQIADSGGGVVIADSLRVPEWSAEQSGYSQFVVGNTDWLKQHGDLARKFASAVQQATKFINQNPKDASVLASARKGLPGIPDAVLSGSIGQVQWPVSDAMDAATWTTTLNFVNKMGAVSGGATVSSTDWTNSYVS